VRSGRVGDAPKHAVVPHWIRKVLLKGLKVAPQERHVSIDALLTALSSDPGRRRRRTAGAVTTAAVLAVGLFFVRLNGFTVRNSSAAEPSCLDAEQKLSGIWDGAEKDAIRRAFLATNRPRATQAWASVEHALDGYAREWTAERTEVCTKTRGRGGLEPTTLRRMSCLDDRLTEMRGLSGILEHADAEIVANAVEASHSLSPVQSCRDPKSVASVLKPVEPRNALRVSELRQELATVTALTETHKLNDARPRARSLVEAAAGIGYAPLEAQALLAEATLLEAVAEPDKAEPLLYRAAWLADAAADDRTRAVVWLRLLADVGLRQGESLSIVREQAMAAYGREGRPDGDLEIRYLGALALAAAGAGNHVEARNRTVEQVALLEKVYGDAHWKYATGLDALARYDILLGDHESALRRLVRAREVLERAGAADTDLCSHVESTMGKSLLYLLRSSEAETHFRRAVEIEERTGRPNNQRLVVPLFNVGRALADQGRFDEAAVAYERSIAIHRTMLPAMHPHFWEFYTALAGAELAQGKAAAALARLEPLLNLKEAQDSRWFSETELYAAKALTALRRDPKRAHKLAQSALERLAGPQSGKGPRRDRQLAEARAWIAEHGGA
jgi:tetratricopeptide (TPR) repeat protein